MKKFRYRNSIDVISEQGGCIDAGSLWEEIPNKPGNLVLVDDDEYHTCEFISIAFSLEEK